MSKHILDKAEKLNMGDFFNLITFLKESTEDCIEKEDKSNPIEIWFNVKTNKVYTNNLITLRLFNNMEPPII